MMDDYQRLTFYPLKWIWLGGLHPETNSIIATIHFLLNFFLFASILVFAVMQILISYQDNIFYTIDSILTVFLYVHILGKFTILRMHKGTLSNLLQQRSKFWELKGFDFDLTKECQKSLEQTLSNIKFYLAYSCLVVVSYLIQPIVTQQLPVVFYVPEGWYYFWFFAFWYLTPSIMASIWGVDTTFYSVSAPVSVQFKLLAHKFEKLDFGTGGEKLQREITEMINYHNFLVWYCSEINRMSSGIFFVQFLVAIATSCVQLFIASQSEFGLVNKLKCLSYFTMQIIETAIYCFTTEEIAESSSEVGNAIYRSSWYNTSCKSRKELVLVIARSQKPPIFNGFGLVHINKQTFTQIFKTALSFFTYLNTMVLND